MERGRFFSVILRAAKDLTFLQPAFSGAGARSFASLRTTREATIPYPLSIKGVLIHDGRVLLLLNERGEWDLPGGRPDPGEDHPSALVREVREETGLAVEVGTLIDEHLFEVLPQRFVRIVAYACILAGTADITLSDEHLRTYWAPMAELAEVIAGHRLPSGYLNAIRAGV